MNVLGKEKQIAVIGSLAEGASIRSVERITGIHRDTIMRLGLRMGECSHTSSLWAHASRAGNDRVARV